MDDLQADGGIATTTSLVTPGRRHRRSRTASGRRRRWARSPTASRATTAVAGVTDNASLLDPEVKDGLNQALDYVNGLAVAFPDVGRGVAMARVPGRPGARARHRRPGREAERRVHPAAHAVGVHHGPGRRRLGRARRRLGLDAHERLPRGARRRLPRGEVARRVQGRRQGRHGPRAGRVDHGRAGAVRRVRRASPTTSTASRTRRSRRRAWPAPRAPRSSRRRPRTPSTRCRTSSRALAAVFADPPRRLLPPDVADRRGRREAPGRDRRLRVRGPHGDPLLPHVVQRAVHRGRVPDHQGRPGRPGGRRRHVRPGRVRPHRRPHRPVHGRPGHAGQGLPQGRRDHGPGHPDRADAPAPRGRRAALPRGDRARVVRLHARPVRASCSRRSSGTAASAPTCR